MDKKWNWELDSKTQNIYENLSMQIEKTFRHCREGSIETRHRYESGVEHFAKYLAEVYHKQNMNKISAKHLEGYVEQMKEWQYSKSYISTNLSAIRYFIDKNGGDSSRLPTNRELGADARTKEDRVGQDRAWSDNEVVRFVEYTRDVGHSRYADMVVLARSHGLRIHEVTRLDKSDLKRALDELKLTVKGKGGLIRSIPVSDYKLIEKLYNEAESGKKIFVRDDEKTHEVISKIQSFIYNNQDKFRDEISNNATNRTFHGLRHAYAKEKYKHFISKGFDDKNAKLKVAHLLGHFRPEITETYLS